MKIANVLLPFLIVNSISSINANITLLQDLRKTAISGEAFAGEVGNPNASGHDAFSHEQVPDPEFSSFASSLSDQALVFESNSEARASADATQQSTITESGFDASGDGSLLLRVDRNGPPDYPTAEAEVVSLFEVTFSLDAPHSVTYQLLDSTPVQELIDLSTGQNLLPAGPGQTGTFEFLLHPGAYRFRAGMTLSDSIFYGDLSSELSNEYAFSVHFTSVPDATDSAALLSLGLIGVASLMRSFGTTCYTRS